MANGTVESAESVKPGAVIQSYDFMTHSIVPSVVSSVLTLTATNKYTFNNALNVDSNEIMYINGRWARASSAKVGDSLFDPLTNSNITITSLQITDYTTPQIVYDFVGSPFNNYIADGYLIDVASTSPNSVSGASYVTLANGTPELVSQVLPGTVVLGYDTQTGKVVPTIVTGIYARNSGPKGNEYIINNGALVVDSGEPLLINGHYELTLQLRIGDKLYMPLLHKAVNVTSIQIINGTFTFYELLTTPTKNFIDNGYVAT